MPAKQMPEWPIRGTPGGWIDDWDDPDPVAAAQDQAERAAAERGALAEVWRAASTARSGGKTDRSAADADAKSPDA